MELLAIVALFLLIAIVAGGICGLIALLKIGALSDEIRRLTLKLHHLERVLRGGAPPEPEPRAPPPAPA
ncbi:MAG: hypothetical protein ABIF82_14720, partial [Planctomycetota bacterium]